MKKSPNESPALSDRKANPEITRAQKLVAELIREAIKEKVVTTHSPVPLQYFRSSVGKCFDRVQNGEQLLVVRKLDPIVLVEKPPVIIPDYPRVSTKDIQVNRNGLLAGGPFVVERASPGRGGNRREVAILKPPPKLTHEELEQIRSQINAIFDEIIR